jgi:hypothetical protein
MTAASRILLTHRLLLALGVIAWLIGVGGYLYARVFVSNALALRAVMSPRTFTEVTSISVSWWLSVVVTSASSRSIGNCARFSRIDASSRNGQCSLRLAIGLSCSVRGAVDFS